MDVILLSGVVRNRKAPSAAIIKQERNPNDNDRYKYTISFFSYEHQFTSYVAGLKPKRFGIISKYEACCVISIFACTNSYFSGILLYIYRFPCFR